MSSEFQLIRRYGTALGAQRLKNWATSKISRRRQTAAFRRQFDEFSEQEGARKFRLEWKDRMLCLDDDTELTQFDRHYVYHPAWAARILKRIDPEVHIDIGSSLFFASVVSAFTPVKFYDFRPADVRLSGLEVHEANLTDLQFEDRSIGSLSCMHVIEHIGLGRYGDGLDPNGDLKAMSELQRVLAAGGHLLFVVPVGQPKVVFNAHRVYSYDQVVEQFPDLMLKEFALIPQHGSRGLVIGASKECVSQESYGCGCFWFSREECAPENSGKKRV